MTRRVSRARQRAYFPELTVRPMGNKVRVGRQWFEVLIDGRDEHRFCRYSDGSAAGERMVFDSLAEAVEYVTERDLPGLSSDERRALVAAACSSPGYRT